MDRRAGVGPGARERDAAQAQVGSMLHVAGDDLVILMAEDERYRRCTCCAPYNMLCSVASPSRDRAKRGWSIF